MAEKNIKEFDLNIEKILENWEVYHAIREIIANALDEQILTNTDDIQIYVDDSGWWHIRDFGRGLNYHHLTQNENEEKLSHEKLIGRFGVGLKDALATLYRNNIKVKIISKYGTITLKTSLKYGFEDIETLHAEIAEPEDPNFVGTDFCLFGCAQKDIDKAEALFLKFSHATILETTKYGDVIENDSPIASIYINGVKVAEEENFLFSYNITSLTAPLKKALNRERSNVGRGAYTDRIKSILKECKSDEVISDLVEDLQQFGSGRRHDELSWNDVALYASVQMSKKNRNTTFVTTSELENHPSLIDDMKRNGFNPVVISDDLRGKMNDYNQGAMDGETLGTSFDYLKKQQDNFIPTVIDPDKLTKSERKIYDRTGEILAQIGGKPKNVKEIQIVDKFYNYEDYDMTLGMWVFKDSSILILRDTLVSLEMYAGTLLHECAHAISGADDVDRDFELELTDIIGKLSALNLKG